MDFNSPDDVRKENETVPLKPNAMGPAVTGTPMTHAYLATIHPQPVMGQLVSTLDGNPINTMATAASPCWVCNGTEAPETMFSPCNCAGYVHRHCFRKWRQGWINPRNYFSCPKCMFKYNLERIADRDTDSEARLKKNYRFNLFKLLATVFLVIGLSVFGLAGISYGLDTRSKNIPVAIKYMMSSVVNGVPHGNTTEIWETNFKKADVRVWPYYTLFAIFLVSLMVLITFAGFGCTFNIEDKRTDRRCCEDCRCCDNTTSGWSCYYFGNCPCDDCNCTGNPCSGCSGGGGSDCKCDAPGEAFIIILIVIVVAVILSALFVIIFYTMSRAALLYDRYTHMLLSQQEELEGDTIVLGKYESWRPLDAV